MPYGDLHLSLRLFPISPGHRSLVLLGRPATSAKVGADAKYSKIASGATVRLGPLRLSTPNELSSGKITGSITAKSKTTPASMRGLNPKSCFGVIENLPARVIAQGGVPARFIDSVAINQRRADQLGKGDTDGVA